jgi:toxin FitB
MRPLFDRRALPVTEDILLQWRLMIEVGRKRGRPFSHPDILIAATAAQHGLTVVTRNTGEFAAAGVAFFNPWEA